MAAADLLKLEPVAVAKAWTLDMTAATISARITAYSTAVGPSSLAKNLFVFFQMGSTLGSPAPYSFKPN